MNYKGSHFATLVGLSIGEASMCWSETPIGIYDSTRASSITDRIINAHEIEIKRLKAMLEKCKAQRDTEYRIGYFDSMISNKINAANRELDEVGEKAVNDAYL